MSGKTITWIVVIIIVLGGGYWWYTGQGTTTDVTPTADTPATTVPAQ